MVVVGYDTDPESGIKYWILKNSWGKQAGINGYVHMERGYNICGIVGYAIALY